MNAIRYLGLAGLASAMLSSMAGFWNAPVLLGFAGIIMVAANTYALWHGK